MNNRTTLCNNERNTFDVKCKSEKQRYHNLSSAFLLASVLLMATFVAWPNQAAYAHDSGLHDFCWDQTLNAFDFLPDLVPFFFFFLKIIALLVALALGSALSLLCAPQIVPPATNTILLTCNTFGFDPARNAVIGGFKAKSGETKSDSSKFITKTADPFTLAPGSPPTFGEFRMTGTNDDGDNVGFTVIHFVESFLTWILIVFPIIFSLIPGGGKIFNKVKDVLNFAISTALGFLDYKFFMKQNAPLDGHISHPVARPNFINTNKDHNHFYPLGANTIEYSFPWGTASGGKETADFKFNVIDTETPQIIFSNKTIKLEANAHFGFIVNSATRAQLGTVTMEDDCFPEKPATYKGQSFYSLTNIAGPQTAKWEVSETSYSIHEFSPEDPAIKAGGASLSVTKEIAKVFYGKWLEKKTFQEVQILQDQIDEIRDLRRNGATQVADLELSIDKRNAQIDDLELGLKNSDDPKLKGIFGKNIDKDKLSKELADQKKKLSADEVELSTKKVKIANAIDDVKLESLSKQLKKKNFKLKELGGKFGGKLGGAALGAVFAVGGAALGGEWAAKPQPVAVTPIGSNSSLQNIIVEDTLAPNILVLDNVALEVNTTDAEVKIEILPPLVFDIADPFPTLTHNATGSFTELEGDTLKETFKLGQTLIMWNATDFSGNKSPLVKQIVNIKLFGTNNASAAFNHTIPDAFSDFPIDITLNATNLDGDPLEFFIQQSPESGRILSPIDAVFLNKFQLKGTISKLKGITVDDLENVFLTDSENQRVMKLDSDGMFDIAFTTDSVSDRPEAIDAVDSDTYIISDWENNLIVRADVVGNSSSIEKQFDVTGLFEEPKNIANFSNSIFVTDKQNGTVTKLTEFSIFDDLKGISVDENDNVYVVDFGQHKLVKFTKQGIFQSKFSGPPGDPYGIAINQTHILATNLDGNNIESLDMNGNFVSEFGQSGTADGDFDTPLDVELNGTKIYVVDTGNDRIQIFNSTTVHLTSIGSLGGGDGEFDDPQGLAVNGSDIFVADTNNHRIQRINLAAPFFVDDYSNENLWNPFGENVTVNSNTSGIVNFTNVSSGTQTFENGVRRNIGTTLPDDGWTSQFDLITGNNTSNSTGFIWLLTNSTTHPSSADNVDALAVYLNSTQLKIFQEHDGTNSTSSGINITNNTQYFLTFERQAKSQVKLSVFSDPQRQNLIDNPIFNNDTNQNLSDLQILQHTNDNSTGGDPLNLVLDNSTIKPFKFSWIGSCTSGANCNDMTQQSLGLICTSETCIRAANPSSSSQGHFNSPSDVAVNGTHIFAVDTSNGRIQAFNQTGFFVQQIGMKCLLDW